MYNTSVISIIVVSWYGATCKGLNMWYNLVKLRGIVFIPRELFLKIVQLCMSYV